MITARRATDREIGPVDTDAHGNSIYQRLEDEAHARLPQILATLAQRRAAAEGNRP